MSLLAAFDRVAAQKPEPFIAPVPEADEVVVTTVQHGTTYRFPFYEKPGWYRFYPGRARRFTLGSYDTDVEAWERISYLEALPRFYVAAALPATETTWLVVPLVPADAAQRGWRDGEPRTLHLVAGAISPGDIIIARLLGRTLLYDDTDDRLGLAGKETGAPAGVASALAIYARRLEEERAEEERKRIRRLELTTEEKLKFQLDFMGARAEAITPVGKGYRVTWSYAGHTYSMQVRRDARIESAGFCLNSTDPAHNLSAIVRVIEDAHKQHRPDIRGAYADGGDDDNDNDQT